MAREIIKVDILEQNLEEIIEMIISGTHYREIAEKYQVKLYQLFRFITQDKHSARFKEAKEFSAHIMVEECERLFAQAKDDFKLLAVASQLAHHYRWKASMVYGRQYGNKTYKEPEEQETKQVTIKIIRDGQSIDSKVA